MLFEKYHFSRKRSLPYYIDRLRANQNSEIVLCWPHQLINPHINICFLTSFWNLQLCHKRTVGWVDMTLESIQREQALDLRVFSLSSWRDSKRVWWDLIRSKHVTLLWLLSTPGDEGLWERVSANTIDFLLYKYILDYFR